jgi:hypothetical protein
MRNPFEKRNLPCTGRRENYRAITEPYQGTIDETTAEKKGDEENGTEAFCTERKDGCGRAISFPFGGGRHGCRTKTAWSDIQQEKKFHEEI